MKRCYKLIAPYPAPGRPVLTRPRSSGGKHYSLSIEAPITKVINIILAAQENQPTYVVQALDKVMILSLLDSWNIYYIIKL